MIVLLITLVLMFQQDSLLQYGDQVTGTITADMTAIDYQFDGQANDILFVTLYADNRTLHNPLLTPILILRDSSGEIIDSQQVILHNPHWINDVRWQVNLRGSGYEGRASITVTYHDDLKETIPIVITSSAG